MFSIDNAKMKRRWDIPIFKYVKMKYSTPDSYNYKIALDYSSPYRLIYLGQRPSGQCAGFSFQESQIQNHWVASRLNQPFLLPMSIKWVPGTPGDLVVKVNCLLVVALWHWDSRTPSIKRDHKPFMLWYHSEKQFFNIKVESNLE